MNQRKRFQPSAIKERDARENQPSGSAKATIGERCFSTSLQSKPSKNFTAGKFKDNVYNFCSQKKRERIVGLTLDARVRGQQQTKSKKIPLSTRRLGFFSMLFIYDMHFFNFPYRLHASPDTSVVLEIPPCTQQNIFKWEWNGSSSFSRLFNDNGRISAKRKPRTFLACHFISKTYKKFFFPRIVFNAIQMHSPSQQQQKNTMSTLENIPPPIDNFHNLPSIHSTHELLLVYATHNALQSYSLHQTYV